MKYKILIVDDDQDICEMLKEFFVMQGYLVYLANSGKAALESLYITPDIILLDINMPKLDGLSFCKEIRSYVQVPIIFLTAKVEEGDKIAGFMAGGDDYITKPFSLKELQARVIAHLRREERGSARGKVIGGKDVVIQVNERLVHVNGVAISFTKTEFDIIELLSIYKGQTFDKERIYETLWGVDKDGDCGIIAEHIRRIRGKIAKETTQEIIQTVWGVGYRWKA